MMRKEIFKKVPFAIDRKSPEGLAEQMTNLLRQAIVSGYYKTGDSLPTILQWSKILNVSIRVPEAAIAALVKEGLVTARKRFGCIVSARRSSVWVGRVLVVVPDGDHVYYQNMLVGRLRARLAAEGYLVVQVTILRRPDGRYDCAQLDHELRAKPDLAILVENRPDLERRLSKSKVPFCVFGPKACRQSGCALSFIRDPNAAVADFVAHCVKAGVRSVLQVSKRTGCNVDAFDDLVKAGVWVAEWTTPVRLEFGRAEGTQRGAQEAFCRRFRKEGRDWLPELMFFTDDYVAAGALAAFLMEGVRIPEDLKVVSLANAGLGPVYPMSLTRMVNDGAAHGDALAEAVVAILVKRKVRGATKIGPVYMTGESFPFSEK